MEEAPKDYQKQATASLIIGIVGLFTSLLPLCGLPLSVVGLVLGVKGLKSSRRGFAIAGIALCVLGVLLGLGWTVVGAYLAPINQFLQQ